MREIKFKAWDKKTKLMFIPDAIDNRGKILMTINGDYFRPNWQTDVDVLYFTGRTDKNGKEIYYNSDICKFSYWFFCEQIELKVIFIWDDKEMRTKLETIGDYPFTPLWYDEVFTRDFEIIGTKQENPELLEK
jgi:hypothetical protein